MTQPLDVERPTHVELFWLALILAGMVAFWIWAKIALTLDSRR